MSGAAMRQLSVILIALGASVVRCSSLLDIRQTAPSLPEPWATVGCFSDRGAFRTLRLASFKNSTNMTIESCLAFCSQSPGYLYAGIEFSSECYCDNVVESSAAAINSSNCSMACVGNSAEICGGVWAISIFKNTDFVPPTPTTTKQAVGTFQYQGCYLDGVNGAPRSLSTKMNISSVTAETCIAACENAGFPVAGLEFHSECWCDSYMTYGIRAPESDCSLACTGDSTEICGGGNRLSVYVDNSVAPLDLNSCLNNAEVNPCSTFQFNLQMVQTGGGASPILLGVVFIGTFGQGTPIQRGIFELSGVNSSLSQDEFNSTAEARIFTLSGNTFLPSVTLAIPQVFSVVPVQPPAGSSQIFLPDLNANTFQGYCPTPNPLSQSTFIGPPVLSVIMNGTIVPWGSCTLSGPVSFNPLTPIFSPTPANGICNDVILEMIPPLVGV